MCLSRRLICVLVGLGLSVATGFSAPSQTAKGKAVTDVQHAHLCVHVAAAKAAQHLQAQLADGPKIARVRITVDETANKLYLVGPADRIAEAKTLLANFDKDTFMPRQPLQYPFLISYPVPAGQAEKIAADLQKKFEREARITAAGSKTILVWADATDQIAISRQIPGIGRSAVLTELISLKALEAPRVLDLLRAMFGQSPHLEADAKRNALLFRGTKDQHEEIKAVLRVLGEPVDPLPATMRIYTREREDAATLAQAIQRLMERLRKNPVRIVVWGAETPQSPTSEKKEKGPAEIVLTVVKNKLIVTSEDTKALAKIDELVHLLTQPAPQCDDVFPAERRDAAAAAGEKSRSATAMRPTGGSGPRRAAPDQ